MNKFIVLVLSILFSTSISAADLKFEKLYIQGAKNIYLASTKNYTKQELKNFGYSVCSQKSFCVIWFFDDSTKAKNGLKTMISENFGDPIPGLIGIYSKNKIINDLICYDKAGSC